MTTSTGRPIHPFRILRVVLPVIYNRELRRLFEALASAWKDIILLFTFYSIIVVFFAILMKELITVPESKVLDDYQSNYRSLGKDALTQTE